MSEEEFRRLFREIVERQEMDPETSQWLLHRILEILFPDSDRGERAP